jgi:hypothetical protein
MIRGTTAPFKIKLPYTIGELEWVTMKWWQDGNKGTTIAPLPITKRLAHCSISNIYVCELSSEVVVSELYYFVIDGIKYKFTAPQGVGVGSLLKYNTETMTLTLGETTVVPEATENVDNATELIFVNEVNNSNELYVTLTAEETMRFSDKHKAKMQLRGKLISTGRIFGCKPRLITVYPINDDLLDDDLIASETNDGWVILDGEPVVD